MIWRTLEGHLEFQTFCPWSWLSTQVYFTYPGVYYQVRESKKGTWPRTRLP